MCHRRRPELIRAVSVSRSGAPVLRLGPEVARRDTETRAPWEGKGAAWPRRRIQATVDAQGRGRAENIDPADQWVFNPTTGEYELRLSPSAPQSTVPSPRRPHAPGGARGRTAAPDRPGRTVPEREVPPPRRRRAAPQEPPPGRRGRRPVKKGKAKKALLWTGGTMAFVVL